MRKLLVLCVILSSCASIPQKELTCRNDCDKLVAAEEARYNICLNHVRQCENILAHDHPSFISSAIYGVIGLGIGLFLGFKVGK